MLIKNTTAIRLIRKTLVLTHLEHPFQLGRELTTALGLEFAENKIYKFSPEMKTSILLFAKVTSFFARGFLRKLAVAHTFCMCSDG